MILSSQNVGTFIGSRTGMKLDQIFQTQYRNHGLVFFKMPGISTNATVFYAISGSVGMSFEDVHNGNTRSIGLGVVEETFLVM
jgi:hypothetical protein